MKNILCILFLAGSLAARAQTPANELFRHVPADADHVYQVKLESIIAKIPWSQLAPLLKDRKLSSNHPLSPADITSFMNSGIDFHKDIVVAQSNAFAADSPRYTTFIVHLTDSGKLAAFVRSKAKDMHGAPIHYIHEGTQRVAVYDNKDAAAWSDHLAVLLVQEPPKTQPGMKTPSGSQTQPGTKSQPGATSPSTNALLARRCAAALRGFGQTSFLSDPRVAAAFADDADVHIWNRHSNGFGGLGKMLAGNKAANLEGFSNLVSKANTDATITSLRFLPGKITVSIQKLITPAEKTSLLRFQGQGLSHELAAAVPPGQILGLLTLHFDMTAWADSIAKLPVAAMFTGPLQKQGLTLQDFPKALKGDFMILTYAPDKNAADAKPSPKLFFLADINDKAAFDKFAKALKMSDAAMPDDSTVTDTAKHKMHLYYGVQGDLAVLSGSREQVGSFFNHPAATSDPTARLLTSQAYTNTVTLGLDMQAGGDFLKLAFTKGDTIAAKDQKVLDAIRLMDVLLITGGAVHDEVMETNIELRMMDTNKNALTSLAQIMANLSNHSVDVRMKDGQ